MKWYFEDFFVYASNVSLQSCILYSVLICKKGGVPWKPSRFRNMLLITKETFNLLDIQRTRHPNLNIYTYASKTLNVTSRLDYFLISESFLQHVKKVGSSASITPDHKTIYIDLTLPQNIIRGPGVWKFNNSLLNDEDYIFKIVQLIPRLREKYSQLEDKSLVWQLMKMARRRRDTKENGGVGPNNL